ncbi:MAG: GNAT family N-acetyltransferase [Proteobacteria bacterium]|nr:GNAT family N-acetyltransferase [Pseudomonadota bacterium]
MTVAVATRPRAAGTAPQATPAAGNPSSTLARIEIFRDMAAAEPFWRALERGGAFRTPYQAFDFLDLWQRHIGAGEGVVPFIVTGFDAAGAPLFVLPFGRRRGAAGLCVIEFLGGKHSNFNMGLYRGDFLGALTVADLERVLAALRGEADVVVLGNQPLAWAGRDNPLALLPHQPSPSFGFSGPLTRDFEALFNERTSTVGRRKMRKKERTLAGFGDVSFARASDGSDIRRVAEDFFTQKSARMRAIGLPDVFAAQDVRDFVTAGALTPTADGSRLIELYTLSVDDTIVATMGGVCADGRFSAMFSSIIHGRYGTESPGEQLLVRVVRDCCERGLHTFDLGVGEANYKSLFCEADAMFDSYWPLSAKGQAFAAARRGFAAAKRAVKQNPVLWKLIVTARRAKARLTKADKTDKAD